MMGGRIADILIVAAAANCFLGFWAIGFPVAWFIGLGCYLAVALVVVVVLMVRNCARKDDISYVPMTSIR